jgi:hypothetical protein
MQKEVFINEHLDAYRNDEKIVKALGGRVLLTHDEFMKWYSPPKIRMSLRNTAKTNRQRSSEEVKNISNAILSLMAESVCESKIGKNYGIGAIRNMTREDFDVLVMVESDYNKVKQSETKTKTKTAANNKIKSVLGFLIAEKGECKRLPNAYTVNLICVRSRMKSPDKPKGSLLLGAYLYCIKKIGQRYGLLELADAYKNVAGFFAYSKMGFVKNTTMFDVKCFTDIGNLPMSVDIAEYRYTDFIDFASGHRKLTEFRDDTGFIDIIPEKGNAAQHNKQIEIARHCNLLYQMPYIYDGMFRIRRPEDQAIVNDIYDYYDDPTLDDCIDYLYERIEELSREFHEIKYQKSPSDRPVSPKTEKSRSPTHSQTKKRRSPDDFKSAWTAKITANKKTKIALEEK